MVWCFSGKKNKSVATLNITLKSGDLKDVAICFSNDPVVHLMLDKKHLKSGSATIKGKKPVWGNNNTFKIDVQKYQRDITVLCVHQIAVLPNKNIGIGYIDATKYVQQDGQYCDQTVNLLDSNNNITGNLVFDIFSTVHVLPSQYTKQASSSSTVQYLQKNNSPSLINQIENQQIKVNDSKKYEKIQQPHNQQYQNNSMQNQMKSSKSYKSRRKSTLTIIPEQSLAYQKYIENQIQQQQQEQEQSNTNINNQNLLSDAEIARQLDIQQRMELQNQQIDHNIINQNYRNNDSNHAKIPDQQVAPTYVSKYNYPVE